MENDFGLGLIALAVFVSGILLSLSLNFTIMGSTRNAACIQKGMTPTQCADWFNLTETLIK